MMSFIHRQVHSELIAGTFAEKTGKTTSSLDLPHTDPNTENQIMHLRSNQDK